MVRPVTRWIRDLFQNPVRKRRSRRLQFETLEERMMPSSMQMISTGDPAIPVLGNSDSAFQSVSADGRYIVFESGASNLVDGDTNGVYDIFRKDLITGELVRVSVDANGNQANAQATNAAMSSDGRFVVFGSAASNLIPGDTNGLIDIFRKDLVTGAIVRANVSAAGAQTDGNSYAWWNAVSDDGRYVLFSSFATNLIAGDTNSDMDVFRKDLVTGEVVRANTDASGNQSTDGYGGVPGMSADGRYVVFQSPSAMLVPGDTNGAIDVFRKDLATGDIVRVSTDAGGNQGNGDSDEVSLSRDGRFVVFTSSANNLVPGDTYGLDDIFRRDLQTGEVVRVNTAGGTQANGESHYAKVSADGRFVSFSSVANNLVAGDTNNNADAFLKDLSTGAVTRVSTSAGGVQGNADSNTAVVVPAYAGLHVFFRSLASNLTTDGDTNGRYDLFRKDLLTGEVVAVGRTYWASSEVNSLMSSVSADGRYVVFERNPDNHWPSATESNIYLADRLTGETVLVSASPSGVQGNGTSEDPSISADGRYVVFKSDATNLVPNDTNNAPDIFRKDMLTGVILRVSTDALGNQGSGWSSNPSISATGRFAVFASTASDLVAGDSNSSYDVFRKDLESGEIVLVSADGFGTQASADSLVAAISADGRFVAFQSEAPLVTSDTNAVPDVYRKDLVTQEIVLVSTDSAGSQGNNGVPRYLSMSASGRYVAFSSLASNLVAGDTNGTLDAFRKDLETGEIVRLSSDSSGNEGNRQSYVGAISADGRYVAMTSYASNLVPGDTNSWYDVFRKDALTGEIVQASTDARGSPAARGSYSTSMSADGRYISLTTDSSNLVAGDQEYTYDVFLKDLGTGALTHISAPAPDPDLPPANNYSDWPRLSADGRYVVFASAASNIVPGDTNNDVDVFRKDLVTGQVVLVSTSAAGQQANRYSDVPSISADGRYVAFFSSATNLVPGTNGYYQVYRKDMLTGEIVCASTNAFGAQGNNGSQVPAISADGRYIAFTSSATNLAPGATNNLHTLRKDMLTGEVRLASADANGFPAADFSNSSVPSISADGRYVAFFSLSTNLVPGDTNGSYDVFRKDMETGAIIRASSDAFGGQAYGHSFDPSLTADGRYLVFSSSAYNLVPDDFSNYDVFRKDLDTGAIIKVSTTAWGQPANRDSQYSSVSGDGRYVSFSSTASNLVDGAYNLENQVYRKDLLTGGIVLVSADLSGSRANSFSYRSAFSTDGHSVVFTSYANNLTAADTNGAGDVFLWSEFVAPVDIALSNATIPENNGSRGYVGALSATDAEAGDTVTFTLVPGADDADNSHFAIAGNDLWAVESFDYETRSVYSVRVRATDGGGLTHEEVFTIVVADANELPTDISLSNSTIAENSPTGTVVGTLSAIDPEGDDVSFVLVEGPERNSFFTIVGNELRTNTSFNYEAQPTFTVRVRALDSLRHDSYEEDFVIDVFDEIEVGAFDVQRGQVQRSFVRYLDLEMDNPDNANALLGAGRVQLIRRDLQGNNPAQVSLAPGVIGTNGNVLSLDFGLFGIGGNRNSPTGDGYYTLQVDTDGDGTYDTNRSFYRLFGDTNGDRRADDADVTAIQNAIRDGVYLVDLDINGDSYVNATDRALAQRFRGRALADGLPLDD